ncbi:MAG TPA: ribulose-phosphate 3-epimerase [Bacilli bacterium]|nr:ribulose-phosphate 3-epimerase [Bacilli bacterium]
MKVEISPSLLAADFRFLDREIKQVSESGCKYLHFDVMDGAFVPNISFGIPVLLSLAGNYPLIFDVHIMIKRVLKYIPAFLDAGADIVTFHYEALKRNEQIKKAIAMIHEAGKKAGISIKPQTPIEVLVPFIRELDLILIMSVEPGFGGQKFDPRAVDKIRELKKIIVSSGSQALIEVDGGINDITGRQVRQAGADILVAGSYLFGHADFQARVERLRGE